MLDLAPGQFGWLLRIHRASPSTSLDKKSMKFFRIFRFIKLIIAFLQAAVKRIFGRSHVQKLAEIIHSEEKKSEKSYLRRSKEGLYEGLNKIEKKSVSEKQEG